MQCNAGLAFFNGLIVEASFPRLFYRLLLGGAPTMADLAELDPPMHRYAYYVCVRAYLRVYACVLKGGQLWPDLPLAISVYASIHTRSSFGPTCLHRTATSTCRSPCPSLYHSYRNLTALLSMSEQELHGLDMTFQVHR